jgi:glycerate dehydrogenase
MKIVVLDGYTENPGDLSWEGLEKLGDLAVYDRTSSNKIVERIGSAEIVYTNKTLITRETLQSAPSLRFIGVLATGYNVVDVTAAKELGVVVTNIPAYGTPAVAQMAIALLLEVCHHVGHHSEAVKKGKWTSGLDFCFWDYPLIELWGKTIGIVGLGSIGPATARIAQALGMSVVGYDLARNEALESEGIRYVELDELLAQADVISLHCPLTEQTQGIIRSATIAKMKNGVIIVNTARGPLIVEADLAEALTSGKVAGAGLDVLEVEPPAMDNPLLSVENCIITPHISWAPKEARERLMGIAVNNLAQFLKGQPVNVVS